MGAGAGVVSDPDSEVLDLQWTLLVDLMSISTQQFDPAKIGAYLVQADNLSIGLLDLAELHQEVPEARLCDDTVDGEDTHAVELWSWVGLGWQVTANDLILCETT